MIESPALAMRTFEQFDGSKWRQYESPTSIFLLTESGRRLLAAENVGRLLHSYADDYHNGRESDKDTRRFLAEGGNARVFSVGNSRLAVKEKRPLGDDLFGALYRMDKLFHAVTVETECPEWIGLPQHYGIGIFKNDTSRQFMLMEKVDEGVTVGDVLNYHHTDQREPHLKESVDRLYGPVTDEFQHDIAKRHALALGELRSALVAKALSPDEFLPDIDHNLYNIVLEPFQDSSGQSSVKFWVIDQ